MSEQTTQTRPKFKIIVALDSNRGIGRNQNIPWYIPPDLKRFAQITKQTLDKRMTNAVIMGRLTYESLPEVVRPLPGRHNVVLTRGKNNEDTENTVYKQGLQEALDYCYGRGDIESVFVIGGGQIYKEALLHEDCEAILATLVDGDWKCDTKFDAFDKLYEEDESEESTHFEGTRFQYVTYRRK